MGVKNYLIDGVSCAGTTTVCNELQQRGYHAIHGDRQLAYWGDPHTGQPVDEGTNEVRMWLWDVEKITALVADHTHAATFFCGGSRNLNRFVCDNQDTPVATAFIWKAYDAFHTLHWLKVAKAHESQGIGRALLSLVLQELPAAAYPVYLHTQPASYRAIKLYSDFGFAFITDPIIGNLRNDLDECLPILKTFMPSMNFQQLHFTTAPAAFVQKLASEPEIEF